MPDTLMRRFMPINLAKRVDAPHCEDCNARHAGLCDALSDDDLSLLANAAHSVSVAAEAAFMEEGEKATYFYNVNDGFVRLFKSLSDGRRQIIGFAGAGAFLGLADSKTYVVSAEAMGGAKLCRFDRKSMREAFVTFPALERRLLEIAMHELALSSERFLLLGRKTARERLASFFLSWAVQMDFCTEDGVPPAGTMLHLPMSRTDIADYLGLTIETVSRSFSQLRKDGILLLPEIHKVVLLKPQWLARIAQAA